MDPGRPKYQSSHNGFKTCMFIEIVDMNPTQHEHGLKQTLYAQDIMSIFILSNKKKKDVDCIVHTIHTVLMWKLNYKCHTDIQLMWQGTLALTWVGTGGPVRV
jgi:hypothetical protein